MPATRSAADAELKRTVVPALRALGFRGSYPHFYREIAGHIDLACVQFSQSGGKFVIELSYAGPDRGNVYANTEVLASELRVSQTTERLRLGSAQPHSDHWFVFNTPNASLDHVCQEAAKLLHSQGEAWWAEQRHGA